jgi:hypothetical protein
MADANTKEQKSYNVIVNGRERTVTEKKLSFEDVVKLAFDNPGWGPNIFFTVAYRKGEDKKSKGTIVAGDTVVVKDGMIFDVTRTDKS